MHMHKETYFCSLIFSCKFVSCLLYQLAFVQNGFAGEFVVEFERTLVEKWIFRRAKKNLFIYYSIDRKYCHRRIKQPDFCAR